MLATFPFPFYGGGKLLLKLACNNSILRLGGDCLVLSLWKRGSESLRVDNVESRGGILAPQSSTPGLKSSEEEFERLGVFEV